MAVYLLDKGIFLAFLNGNPLIKENIKARWDKCYLPAIVAAQLYENQLNFTERKQELVEQLIEQFSIIGFNETAALKYATIQKQLKQESKAASIVDVIIAATALACNATIITHRIEEFKILTPNLQRENWINSSRLYVTENKPGSLYKVANFFKELSINILADYHNGIESGREPTQVNVTIDLPLSRVKQTIKPMIDDRNVEFEKSPEYTNATLLKFICNPPTTINSRDNSQYQTIRIEGKDRVGLLADVAELIFKRNINIGKSYSRVSQENDSRIFSMMFTMLNDRENIDWDTLIIEVRNINGLQACYVNQ